LRRTPLWLSHHEPAHHARCMRLLGLQLCARCLGVYSALFATLSLEVAVRAPARMPYDGWIAFALPVPAVLDWARGRWRPQSGTNGLRLFTGALLGVALGRTLYLHLRQPGHPLAMAQFLALAAFAAVVEGGCLWRRRSPGRPDRSPRSPVQPSDRSDREP